ncbi:hypothetical protein EVAR_89425_1 [Eumeta japonica]|uniref:Uncharacterized protein n=1 Tax=Eumeta variegata TaxID=151549 RepID=A0A4C1Z0G5_EUMVA|nr:hypothetical protein EVAR_89425_1 [Eumeta japonica]
MCETFLACWILSQTMQPEVRFAGDKSYSRRRPNILVPVQALHTDGRHFKDAAKYKPERFDWDSIYEFKKQNVYLPFKAHELVASLTALAALLHKSRAEAALTTSRHPTVSPHFQHHAKLQSKHVPDLDEAKQNDHRRIHLTEIAVQRFMKRHDLWRNRQRCKPSIRILASSGRTPITTPTRGIAMGGSCGSRGRRPRDVTRHSLSDTDCTAEYAGAPGRAVADRHLKQSTLFRQLGDYEGRRFRGERWNRLSGTETYKRYLELL